MSVKSVKFFVFKDFMDFQLYRLILNYFRFFIKTCQLVFYRGVFLADY